MAAHERSGARRNGPAAPSAGPAADDGQRPAYRLKRTLEGHTKAVVAVKFSHGGERLASASADQTARVWQTLTGECVHVLSGHTQGVNDVAWDPADRYLATASDDRTLGLWDAATGERLRTLEGHTNFVFCCAFNPRQGSLVSGSFDETVRVWEARTGQEIKTLPAHSDPVTAVDFSADGTLLVSASFDGLARVWDAAGAPLGCVKTLSEAAAATPPLGFARFAPNGRYVLVAAMDSTLKLWDYERGRPVKVYTGHRNKLHAVFAAFAVGDRRGPWVVSGSEDHGVYLWHLNSQQLVQVLEGRDGPDAPGPGHCDAVLAVSCHPREPLIASGGLGRDCTIKLWADGA